ncbi:MAG: ParB N-terminal domain-containing protein [Acidobacteriaceae bacterium]
MPSDVRHRRAGRRSDPPTDHVGGKSGLKSENLETYQPAQSRRAQKQRALSLPRPPIDGAAISCLPNPAKSTAQPKPLPLLAILQEAPVFEDSALKELADSIRTQGILSPLLVRPLTEQSFEIVAGARRYRAAFCPARSLRPLRSSLRRGIPS